MPSYITHIREDDVVVAALQEIAAAGLVPPHLAKFAVVTDFGSYDWTHNLEVPAPVENIVGMHLQVVMSASVVLTSPPGSANLTVAWSRRKAGAAPTLTVSGNTQPADMAFAVVRLARNLFRVVVDEPRFNQLLSEDTQTAYAEFLSASSRLAHLNEELGTSLAARRLELEAEYQERERRLLELADERARRAEDLAKNAAASLRDDVKQEKEALAKRYEEREKELLARQAELDGLAARHSRRALRDDMKTLLKQREDRFELTSETQSKRTWIHRVSIAAIVLLVVLAVAPLNLAPESVPESARGWYEVIRRSLFFMGAAGLLTFYLRWQNAWFKQHADTEFHLRQFSLDVDRASWLVETVTDLREKEGIAVPERLLEALSAGLFEPRDRAAEEAEQTVETLARALLASDRMKLNVAGQEIELSGRQLRKVGRE